jgi:hypothetical protein
MSYEEIKREPVREVTQIPVKQYELVSERRHPFICSCIEDLDEQNFGFGTKRYLKLWLEITDEKRSDGLPFVVKVLCVQSLHPKSKLYGIVAELAGHDPARNFNLAKLKGMRGTLEIVHEKKDSGAIFANACKIRRLETAAEIASEKRVAKVRNGVNKSAREHDARVANVTEFQIPGNDVPN